VTSPPDPAATRPPLHEVAHPRAHRAADVARLVLAPDWRTITWTEAERAKGQAWGLKTIRLVCGRR
jgi:hypothetical protein